MKARSSGKSLWLEPVALVALVALAVLGAPMPRSTAQTSQDNRRLTLEPMRRSTERRIALVIGNGAYTNAPPLRNPPNDARDMVVTLKELGFDVASGINVNQREMKSLIRDFGQALKAGGAGLFYYAGHGVQSKGRNYLIPVDADIQSEAELEDSSVDANLLLNYMDDAQNGLNIVILDACRNNPFARSFRSASIGLAQVDAPTGTLIAYATGPGRVASDGTGQNGLYTAELLRQMRVPGLSVSEMFMRVRAEVMKLTENKQVPWEASSLVGAFYFSAPLKNKPGLPTSDTANGTKIDPVAVEREYWESIRSSTSAQDYRDYLSSYPSGAYVAIAKTKLRQLEEAGTALNDARGKTNSGASKTTSRPSTTLPQTRTNETGIEFVLIQAGEFMMGSREAGSYTWPVHRVAISQPFYLGKYEVTQGQWWSVMENKPSLHKNCDNCPVELVSWDDVQQFMGKLNAMKDGYRYRLPTEAEWEYACRAGTTVDLAGDVDSIAWYNHTTSTPAAGDNGSGYKTHPVGTKQPNHWGLCDMLGNVWEWCQDWYDTSYYRNSPSFDPQGPDSGRMRVLRGGGASDSVLGAAVRDREESYRRRAEVGFRVVATLIQ